MSEDKNQGIDPFREIRSLYGESLQKSGMTPKEINDLPKDNEGRPDFDKAERETVGNVVLNCLGSYKGSKVEGFMANSIAMSIIDAKKGDLIEFKKKYVDFIITVLENSIYTEDEQTKQKSGLYRYWVISQVLNEFGVNED